MYMLQSKAIRSYKNKFTVLEQRSEILSHYRRLDFFLFFIFLYVVTSVHFQKATTNSCTWGDHSPIRADYDFWALQIPLSQCMENNMRTIWRSHQVLTVRLYLPECRNQCSGTKVPYYSCKVSLTRQQMSLPLPLKVLYCPLSSSFLRRSSRRIMHC